MWCVLRTWYDSVLKSYRINSWYVFYYRLDNPKACKHLWKCAIEHHTFFRVVVQPTQERSKQGFIRLGSRFRYRYGTVMRLGYCYETRARQCLKPICNWLEEVFGLDMFYWGYEVHCLGVSWNSYTTDLIKSVSYTCSQTLLVLRHTMYMLATPTKL